MMFPKSCRAESGGLKAASDMVESGDRITAPSARKDDVGMRGVQHGLAAPVRIAASLALLAMSGAD